MFHLVNFLEARGPSSEGRRSKTRKLACEEKEKMTEERDRDTESQRQSETAVEDERDVEEGHRQWKTVTTVKTAAGSAHHGARESERGGGRLSGDSEIS